MFQQLTGDMPVQDFRRFGHQLVDWIADFQARIDDVPVVTRTKPGDLKRALPTRAPQSGEEMEAILADVDRLIMPAMTHWNHPSNHAYFNSSASGPGILGELLGSTFNVNCMLWQSCPAGTELEEVTLDWLRQLLGMPASFWGIIYDSASSANMHAIAAAREQLGLGIREEGLAGRHDVSRIRVYASEQVHSSVEKAAVVLGLGLESVRKIPTDDKFRMRPDLLRQAISADRAGGWQPCCVVGVVGTTSTTAIDPIPDLADICDSEGLWLHVDAAHGGAAALAPECRQVLDGCERADSFVVNPHKWMFVPLDLSAFYTRRREVLKRTFSLVPEYLRTEHDDQVVNYMDYGVALGRRFRAMKLWFVLRYFGADGLAARIREHIRLARSFADWVKAHPDFEIMAPTPLSTVCFRAHPTGVDTDAELNHLNQMLLSSVNNTGRVFLTHTKLGDRLVLRFVVSHLRTTDVHVLKAWALLQEKLRELIPASTA